MEPTVTGRQRERAVTGMGAGVFVGICFLIAGAPRVMVLSLVPVLVVLGALLMNRIGGDDGDSDAGIGILGQPKCPDRCHRGDRVCDWPQPVVDGLFDGLAQTEYDAEFTDLVTNVWIISRWTVKS